MTASQQPATVSVVIPMYNSAATISEQLAALAQQTYDVPFEVVIADNGSTDQGRGIVAGWNERFAHLRIVDAAGRRGPAAARNAGLRAANGSFLLTCDADDIVDAKWIEKMVDAADEEVVLGGRLDSAELNPGTHATWRRIPEDGPSSILGRTYFLTSNMGFSAGTYRALGGFRSAFDTGGADVDFCWRAHELGFEVRYVPEAVVNYRFRHEVGSFVRQSFGYGRSYSRLLRAHPNWARHTEARSTAIAGSAGRLARTAVGAVASGSQRARLAGQFGYYAGRTVGRLERWDPDRP